VVHSDIPDIAWVPLNIAYIEALDQSGFADLNLNKMLDIHRQPIISPQLPSELLHRIITSVIVQSVHSICVLSDDVEWELKLMETLCLVSSAFRDIALEVACKALSAIPPVVPAKLRSLHSRRLTLPIGQALDRTSIPQLIKDDLVSGYFVYMAAVHLRHNSPQISAYMLKEMHEMILPLLQNTITRCGRMEPPGVGDLLRSSLSDEMDIVKIGMVLIGYISLGQR